MRFESEISTSEAGSVGTTVEIGGWGGVVLTASTSLESTGNVDTIEVTSAVEAIGVDVNTDDVELVTVEVERSKSAFLDLNTRTSKTSFILVTVPFNSNNFLLMSLYFQSYSTAHL